MSEVEKKEESVENIETTSKKEPIVINTANGKEIRILKLMLKM